MFSFFKKRRDQLPPTGQNASVYFDSERIFLCAHHHLRTRFNGVGRPCKFLDRRANSVVIGAVLNEILRGSRDDMEESELEYEAQAVCAAAGVAEINDIEQYWGYLSVHKNGAEIVITPWHPFHLGGYIRLKGDPEYRCSDDPNALGKQLVIAMNASSPEIIDESHLL